LAKTLLSLAARPLYVNSVAVRAASTVWLAGEQRGKIFAGQRATAISPARSGFTAASDSSARFSS
jgi:hypothetical protein